jgi:hypothetical protein
LIPEAVDVVADVVNRVKQIGDGAGLAGIADILLALADLLEIGGLAPASVK